MAIIAGHYVWVKSESIDTPVEVAEHPVETGTEITSHIRPKPATLSISGEIVGGNYRDLVAHFRSLARGGYLVSFIGRNVFPNAYIRSFTTRATSEVAGGVAFDMELRELRIARKNWQEHAGYTDDMLISMMNYDGTTSVENLSEPKERYHAMMAGETLYFVAEQYRSRGVTADALRELNAARPIFRPGHAGEFDALLPGARLLLGVW